MSNDSTFAESPETYIIKGAFLRLLSNGFHTLIEDGVDNIKVIDRFFRLPLDYAHPDGEKIRVFARTLIPKNKAETEEDEAKLPYCKIRVLLSFAVS